MPCESPCDACKPGDLPILFTRYAAAFSAEPERAAALKKLKPSGQFKAPSVSLKTAGYSVRMLREGVLYVLTERAGAKSWRGFMVHAHGYLSEFNPLLTPSPSGPAAPACEVAIRGANKSLVWIADPKNVSNLWYFFHPDTVLPDVLRNLKADPAKLHKLDVSAWVGSCPPTPHTCMPDALGTQVGEWAALTDSVMLDALNEQIYGVMGLDTAQQGYGQGQIPVYANAALNKTTTNPPPKDIFSADNPWGSWTRTDRLGPGTLPAYAKVHGARLENIAQALAGEPGNPNKPPGIVAACDDAIGIAQETNHWRNKPYRDLIIWGDGVEATPDKSNRQSRKTRFEVGNTLVMMAPLFKQKRIALAVRAIAFGQGVSERPQILDEMTEAQRRAPMTGRVFNTRADYDAYMAKLQSQTEVANGPLAETRWAGYMAAIDTGAIDRWRKTYADKAQHFENEATRRAPDALAWVNSGELQDALARYNGKGRSDLTQGAKCSAQINGILEGMGGGGNTCEGKLMEWAKDFADNPKNLLWRGYLLNQEDMQAPFAAAMAAAQAPGKSAPERVEQFKFLIDKFAKFNDLMAGKNDLSLRLAQAIPLFGMNPALNLLMHTIFKVGSGKAKFENALARALMDSVAAGAGSESAFRLYAEQQAEIKKITPHQLLSNKNYTAAHARGKLNQTRRTSIDKVINEGGQGDFFKLRVTSALTMLEGLLFLAKANELAAADGQEATRRAALQFGAAGLMTTAAALEVGGLMQEWLATKSSSPAAREMAEIRLGGFKLAGNALAGIAGVVGAYYDFKDAGKADAEQKTALMWVFRARAYTNVGAISTGLALGYSYAGPLLEHLGQSAGGNAALEGLATGAKWLAERRAWLFAATWWLTFMTIAVTIVIGWLDDDAMQKWCAKSSFRKPAELDKEQPPLYGKPGEELMELYNAFRGATS